MKTFGICFHEDFSEISLRKIESDIKRPGCEADHSPPSSAVVKNAWNYNSDPPYVFME
jgi:hypothetical protein